MKRKAFTMIEIIVVIAIISIIASILIPLLQSARRSGYIPASLSNLRQLSHASSLYESDFGALAMERNFYFSWQNQLDPYLQGMSRFHPPLFSQASKDRFPNGYVENSCVGTIDKREYDPQRLILFAEHALLFGKGEGGARGFANIFLTTVPDVIAPELPGFQMPGLTMYLEGPPLSTIYHGGGAYLAVDGHAAILPINAIDYNIGLPNVGFSYVCEPGPPEASSPPGRMTYRLNKEY